MSTEIERKFLVKPEWHAIIPGQARRCRVLHQGYLSVEPIVRVQSINQDGRLSGKVAVKGKGNISRAEFEYEVPNADAQEMLLMARFAIHKVRFDIVYGGKLWEIDRFEGALQGLWLAEVELEREDEPYVRPLWLDTEVTFTPGWSNVELAQFGVPQ